MAKCLGLAVDRKFGTGLGGDIETFPTCGGVVRIIACIEGSVVIQTILGHLKTKEETCEPFPLPESRAPG